MAGTLYLCATPIGNLGDITSRVVETLGSVDMIAAEDTRNSLKLLSRFDIHVPMTSYHEHNKAEKGKELLQKLLDGKDIALICDAGTPAISDPGEDMVRMCIEAGVRVTSLPGASACITALTLSGLSTRRFCFEGFLPNEKSAKKEQRQVLERLATETRTSVFYEAPHRLLKTLGILEEAIGPERKVAVCRELSKKHEDVFRGGLGEAISHYEEKAPKGEIVLVIEGADPEELERKERLKWQDMDIPEHMQIYLDKGQDRKEAMKSVARDRGCTKREIYAILGKLQDSV